MMKSILEEEDDPSSRNPTPPPTRPSRMRMKDRNNHDHNSNSSLLSVAPGTAMSRPASLGEYSEKTPSGRSLSAPSSSLSSWRASSSTRSRNGSHRHSRRRSTSRGNNNTSAASGTARNRHEGRVFVDSLSGHSVEAYRVVAFEATTAGRHINNKNNKRRSGGMFQHTNSALLRRWARTEQQGSQSLNATSKTSPFAPSAQLDQLWHNKVVIAASPAAHEEETESSGGPAADCTSLSFLEDDISFLGMEDAMMMSMDIEELLRKEQREEEAEKNRKALLAVDRDRGDDELMLEEEEDDEDDESTVVMVTRQYRQSNRNVTLTRDELGVGGGSSRLLVQDGEEGEDEEVEEEDSPVPRMVRTTSNRSWMRSESNSSFAMDDHHHDHQKGVKRQKSASRNKEGGAPPRQVVRRESSSSSNGSLRRSRLLLEQEAHASPGGGVVNGGCTVVEEDEKEYEEEEEEEEEEDETPAVGEDKNSGNAKNEEKTPGDENNKKASEVAGDQAQEPKQPGRSRSASFGSTLLSRLSSSLKKASFHRIRSSGTNKARRPLRGLFQRGGSGRSHASFHDSQVHRPQHHDDDDDDSSHEDSTSYASDPTARLLSHENGSGEATMDLEFYKTFLLQMGPHGVSSYSQRKLFLSQFLPHLYVSRAGGDAHDVVVVDDDDDDDLSSLGDDDDDDLESPFAPRELRIHPCFFQKDNEKKKPSGAATPKGAGSQKRGMDVAAGPPSRQKSIPRAQLKGDFFARWLNGGTHNNNNNSSVPPGSCPLQPPRRRMFGKNTMDASTEFTTATTATADSWAPPNMGAAPNSIKSSSTPGGASPTTKNTSRLWGHHGVRPKRGTSDTAPNRVIRQRSMDNGLLEEEVPPPTAELEKRAVSDSAPQLVVRKASLGNRELATKLTATAPPPQAVA